jgi:hypothetical protein
MQGMDPAFFTDCPLRGDQGLPDHLSSIDALPANVWTYPSEKIDFQRLEVKGIEKRFDSLGHKGFQIDRPDIPASFAATIWISQVFDSQ